MKLHQINEDDLAELEQSLPVLMMNTAHVHQPADRIKWRRIREIVASVRWNYGPPSECHKVDGEEQPE